MIPPEKGENRRGDREQRRVKPAKARIVSLCALPIAGERRLW